MAGMYNYARAASFGAMPEQKAMFSFGAMPDMPNIPDIPEPAPQPEPELSADAKKFRQAVKEGAINEDGITPDGKMWRGPKSLLWYNNNGAELIRKDKDLMQQWNKMTIAENRELAGLPPLEEETPQPQAQAQSQQQSPEDLKKAQDELLQTVFLTGKLPNGEKASNEMVQAAVAAVRPELSNRGMKLQDREEKMKAAQEAQARKIEESRDMANRALDAASRLRGMLDDDVLFDDVGMAGTLLKKVPGTEAFNFDAVLNTLTSQNVIQTLNNLKSQSATGATGFGALSERELDTLIGALGSLKQGMTKTEFLKSLAQIEDMYRKALTPKDLTKTMDFGETVQRRPDDDIPPPNGYFENRG